MIYVEWLRARHRFAVVGGGLAVLIATLIAIVYFGHYSVSPHGGGGVSIGTDAQSPLLRDHLRMILRDVGVPFGAFLVLGACVSLLFTTTLYTSLHAQRSSLDFAFTKPLSRMRLAATFFGVDLGAVAVFYVVAVVLILLPFVVLGLTNRIVADPDSPRVVALGLGICVLLYGLMQLATAWLRRGGATVVIGAMWFTFILVASISHAPITNVEWILRLLRPLDPIDYIGYLTYSSAGAHPTNLVLPILLAWGFGLVACVLAAVTWQRLEV